MYRAKDLRELFAHMLCDEEGVTALYQEHGATGEPRLSTDDRPRLEYGTPHGNYDSPTREEIRDLLAGYDRGTPRLRPREGVPAEAVEEAERFVERGRAVRKRMYEE